MKARLVCLLALFSLLMGCGAALYIPPQDGDTARIRLTTQNYIGKVSVWKFSDTQCSDRPPKFIALFDHTTVKHESIAMQAMPPIDNPDPTRTREIVVQADTPFVARFVRDAFYDKGGREFSRESCRITVAFTPKKDGLYEVVYSETGRTCNVQIYAMVKDHAGAYKRVESPEVVDRNVKQCP